LSGRSASSLELAWAASNRAFRSDMAAGVLQRRRAS
jgi:hypothetical protein